MEWTGFHFDLGRFLIGGFWILFVTAAIAAGIKALPRAFQIDPKSGLTIAILAIPLALSFGYDFSHLFDRMWMLVFYPIIGGFYMIWKDQHDPYTSTDSIGLWLGGYLILLLLILSGAI